jgi:hypothetical protein
MGSIAEKGAMRTELRAAPHSAIHLAIVFEVWHDGKFLAAITGADGPGVRVISKHPMKATIEEGHPKVVEVKIDTEKATSGSGEKR